MWRPQYELLLAVQRSPANRHPNPKFQLDQLTTACVALCRQHEGADTLVLPSHGRPFRGAHTRIAQLQAHHAERLAELRSACAKRPHSALEALPVLFKRTLNPQQMTFAMGEAVAHLNALWHRGELRRELDTTKGCYRFSTIR